MSLASLTFSPGVTQDGLSSTMDSISPLKIALPAGVSPRSASTPVLVVPLSSGFFVTLSPALNVSLIVSSNPDLMSLTSRSCSSV